MIVQTPIRLQASEKSVPQFPKMLNPLIFVKCLEIFQRKVLNAKNKLLTLSNYIYVTYLHIFV